nr:TetR/AcrR family transcriptional regulator [uncultured Pseudogulbenkiania sp.]
MPGNLSNSVVPTPDEPSAAQTGRRERKRQQQLDHLADTAWALFEAEGYEAVTMERIAEAADVAKGTLYKHFPVKEALLRHRFHRELREGQAGLAPVIQAEAPGAARLRRFFALSAEWSEPHRRYLLPYVQYRLAEPRHPSDERQRSGLERIFAALIADGQAAGCFRQDVSAAVLAVYLEFLYLAALLRWLTEAAPSLPGEFESMLDVFFGGLEVRA